MAIRCYPRIEFTRILTDTFKLKKTDILVDGERAWETPNGNYIFISDISNSEAITSTYLIKIYNDVLELVGNIEPPPIYPWSL